MIINAIGVPVEWGRRMSGVMDWTEAKARLKEIPVLCDHPPMKKLSG